MIVPKAFTDMCVWFMSEIEEDIPSGRDMIAYAIGHLSDGQKKEAAAFIDRILSSGYADQELIDIWFHSGARVGLVNDADYRKLFEEIRRRLGPTRFDP
jgi:hypothetical protein